MAMPLEDGRKAVELARLTLDSHVRKAPIADNSWNSSPFNEPRGVFVTLNRADSVEMRLRGCVGFPLPVRALGQAISDATVAASSEDPRFPPVSVGELDTVVVEVSVLTLPQEVNAQRRQDLPAKVRIGEDGLIITREGFSGLLLPQVAVEYGMDALEFLSQACLKAGLPPDSWLDRATTVQVFQADVFAEATPRGEICRVVLRES